MSYFPYVPVRGKPIYLQCDFCSNLGSRLARDYNKSGKHQSFCSITCSSNAAKSLKLPDHACDNCGKLFPRRHSTRKFCSQTCSASFTNRNRDKSVYTKQSETIRKSDRARHSFDEKSKRIRDAYDRSPKLCVVCGNPKEWAKRSQQTCSSKCAVSILSSPERSLLIAETRRKRFADGSLAVTGGNTRWLDYNGIRVQGTYELRMCHILDRWKTTGEIADWEYTKDRIPYINHLGKKATYLLDFKIQRNDGSEYYIETKGFERANDQLKWAATRDAGFELEVWFKENIAEAECLNTVFQFLKR